MGGSLVIVVRGWRRDFAAPEQDGKGDAIQRFMQEGLVTVVVIAEQPGAADRHK
jgi:hypothetical protein